MFKFYLTLVGNIPINISTPGVFLPVEIFFLFCKVKETLSPPPASFFYFFLLKLASISGSFGFQLNSTQEKLEMYSIFCNS